MKRVGVIGMGLMGSPMACNLVKAGLAVTVFNRARDKCRAAAEAGAVIADSVAQLAGQSDAVLLMLADDIAVKQVALGAGGVAAHARPGTLVIDSSTVHPETSREIAAALGEPGALFLDAPVTGSRPQAEAGKLFFLVGGPRDAYERAIPLFEAMGRRHIHLGATGTGACAKLCNNLAAFINLAGFCEALALGRKFGLEPQRLLQVISDSGGRSTMAELKGPKILRADWSADFALALASKDVRLAVELAGQLGLSAPVAEALRRTMAAAEKTHGANDVAALAAWYQPD